MCGIAGFCNIDGDWKNNIQRMTDALTHRGPDSCGMWSNSNHSVVFGHRRLSVLDLSEAGSQPMVSHSGRYVIVFNGEIYNHKELKAKLDSEKGLRFYRGHSDTEVLLNFIEEYGFYRTLSALKGMFAIAVYDEKKRSLLLGRDRIGEKPLYYGFLEGSFVFASELGAMRALDCFSGEISREALTLYFKYGYIPSPYSIYKGIYKLNPGCTIELKEPFSEIEEGEYWNLLRVAKKREKSRFSGDYYDAVDELERLLREAVRSQMVSDVSLGAFLSGGIDSSLVVSILQSLSVNPVKTFSIGFEDVNYNEAEYARNTAKFLKTDHTELYMTDNEAMDVIPQLPQIYDEPFADSSQLPTYLVSRLAKNGVTVAMSGDGGDELFCGYNTYGIIENVWNRIKNIPYPTRCFLSKTIDYCTKNHNGYIHKIGHYLQAKTGEDVYRMTGNVVPGVERLVLGSYKTEDSFILYPDGFLSDDLKSNLMLMDLKMYHPDDILVKVDRAAMAVSLETRIPMLDKDLVEFALSLPIDYKARNGVPKSILRDVLYRYVPKDMMQREKKGFSVPIGNWIKKGRLRSWMENMLDESSIRQGGLLDVETVKRIKKDFIKHGSNVEMIWYICVFEQWHRFVRQNSLPN